MGTIHVCGQISYYKYNLLQKQYNSDVFELYFLALEAFLDC